MKHHPSSLGQSILNMKERSHEAIAVQYKESGHWKKINWPEYYRNIETIGAALIQMGVQPGDKVAIMSNTRFEWGLCDLAILGIQAVTVPIYPNNTAEDVEYILNNSEAKVFISENRHSLKAWKKIKDNCPQVKQVIAIELESTSDGEVISFRSLYQTGADELKKSPTCFENRASQVKTEDMATLIYTSGTTGRPKGVVLCHEQAMSEILEAFPLCGANDKDVSLAFLPMAHILGRVEFWAHAVIGFTCSYAESIEKIKQNLIEIQPTLMLAVPRIFEKIYSAIHSQMESQPLKKKLFDWALGVGMKVSEHRMTRSMIPLSLIASHELAKKLVLDKIKMAFGGRLRFTISGGAPLSSDIAKFFHACGVLVLEGYGLTETTAAIAVNTPFNYKFGTVGKPIGDVQIKIAPDGEILVKSKKVMKEYYKNPEATKESISDGWFHTGDIGEVLTSGELKITDRKKDLIKTAGGKYVAPQRLEGLLKIQPLISQVLIHGDQKKYIVALITLDRLSLENFAKEHSIEYGNWEDLIKNQSVAESVRKSISETNSQLASFESIKKYTIVPGEWTVDGGELTPSMKVKRKVLDSRYQDTIDSMYE